MREIIEFLFELERQGYASPSVEIGIRRVGFMIRVDGLRRFASDLPGVGPRIVRRDCSFPREEAELATDHLRKVIRLGLPDRDIYGTKDTP